MKPDDMPLHEVSPNIQDLEPASRKRSHDEFSDGLTAPAATAAVASPPRASLALMEGGNNSAPTTHDSPASRSLTKALPEKDANNNNNNNKNNNNNTSSEPSSTTKLSVTLPVKRKRITGAEKEARDKEAAEQKKIRDQLLAEKAAIKAVEKAKLEEAKAARAKERDEKRKKKEEEQQRLQEEKDRKARSQTTLGSFFKIPSTPKKSDGETVVRGSGGGGGSPTKVAAAAPSEEEKSAYATMFQPFFIKDHTRLAAPLISRMDKETRERKSQALDDFVTNQKDTSVEFKPRELFASSSSRKSTRRGYCHRPVKHIMEWAYRESQKSGTAGAIDATKIYDEVRAQLSKIPVKVIAFSRDVRPPYYGTATLQASALGTGNMQRLARRSMSRRLPLNYDYDSEAEWQDEEEGEDIDMDDEEEELDDEDDMDGFLDDSEDAGLARRVFGNTMEPDCTGLCFEDHNRIGPSTAVYGNKMEFMLESLNDQWSMDPFSTTYWEPEPIPVRAKPIKTVKTEADSKMLVPPTPANAFVALQGSGGSGSSASVAGVPGGPAGSGNTNGGQTKLVKAELLNDFKQAILNNKALSKVGIIDIIFHQFRDDVSRAEVKNTLEAVAEKKGTGRLKEWELKPGHEIVM